MLRTADYLRAASLGLTHTYSLALCNMFFDRLGDPGDVPLIESMTVRAVVTEATIRALTNVDVRLLDDGRVAVSALGRTVEGTAAVRDGKIVVDSAVPIPFGVPVPDTGLLPCTPDVTVVAGALRLACSAETLPRIVVDATPLHWTWLSPALSRDSAG